MYKGIDVSFVNLKTLEGREGLIIQCDVKYKGKKIATYFDDGWGGEPRVEAIGSIDKDENGEYQKSPLLIKNNQLLEQLYAEFKTLPKVSFDTEGKKMELNDCLDFAVDKFIEERELLKTAKKGLLMHKDGNNYTVKWKTGSIPTTMQKLGKERFLPSLTATIIQNQAAGYTILMQDYYISLGVNPEVFNSKM